MRVRQALQFAFSVVCILWVIHAINWIVPIDLRQFGIRPRSISGLAGILCAPFLHGNLSHLIANSSALFVLLAVALAYSHRLTLTVIAAIIGLGGLMVWIFGTANATHIGASGVVFGLIGYLLFIGIFRREWVAAVVSAAIFLLYGGTLLSLLVIVPGISWSSHVFGLCAGVIAAAWTKNRYQTIGRSHAS